MLRFFLFGLIIMSIFFSIKGEGYALTTTYIPASKLYMTGITADTRFDVASVLFGTSFSGAHLETGTRNMQGIFYINGIGWALMSTGSYQVQIACSQSLDVLVSDCTFNGKGWSENIGELDFTQVRYNPTTATLSGSIRSFAGDFSVEGIALPLKSVEFTQSLADLTVNHDTSLTVKDAFKYFGGDTWRTDISPNIKPTDLRLFDGGSDGIFADIDLSLAGTYTFVTTDPQGSKTIHSNISINPGNVTQLLLGGNYATTFCISNPSLTIVCPDGATRIATSLNTSTVSTVVADGVDSYDYTLRFRDTYGNRVTSGNIIISYTGTVSNIQIPSSIQDDVYSLQSNYKDALSFSGDIFPVWDFSGNWQTSFVNGLTDIDYSIMSNAPTDGTDNIVVLNKISHTSASGVVYNITDSTKLEFNKPFSAGLNPPESLRVAATNTFTGTFSTGTAISSSPELITLFKIGNGILAYFNNIQSNSPIVSEMSPSTSWLVDFATTSHIITTPSTPTFNISGIYMPTTAFPEIETLYYYGFIHYITSDGKDVVYPVYQGNKTAEYMASKVKIIGQNNARSEYGTIAMNSNIRMNLMSKIRKNITLLNRGRTTYSDVPYVVYTSNKTITEADFAGDHRSIIVVGADVTIAENISKKDYPLAIIALADEDGNGGKIIIEDDVTDLSLNLISERELRSSGDNQLYVYGALVTGNTLGESTANICPYFAQLPCDAKEYDLEYLRGYDGSFGQNPSSKVDAYSHSTALIVEYDMRIQTDPPPGIVE